MKYQKQKLAISVMACALVLGLGSMTVRASPSNALDRIDFGNPTSEAEHNFDPNTLSSICP